MPPPISIHALLTESDSLLARVPLPDNDFNPRSPHGERPRYRIQANTEASFQSTLSSRRATADCRADKRVFHLFQSTLSSRRATGVRLWQQMYLFISIHALLTESDRTRTRFSSLEYRFQSTLSSRRATIWRFYSDRLPFHFNPRSPHGERPLRERPSSGKLRFQSTLSSRRATPTRSNSIGLSKFQSTLSSRRATHLWCR